MTQNLPRIYCAIDCADFDRAASLCRDMKQAGCGVKLGLEFFNRYGRDGVLRLMDQSPDISVFLDLKYHDIPNTVSGAIRAIGDIGVDYLNVHAGGGVDMMGAAREASAPGTCLLSVTILTSIDQKAMTEIGFKGSVSERVTALAQLSRKAGMDGVVCSAHEIQKIRAVCGPDFKLMVPGIRLDGAKSDDQARVMTPQDAIKAGATHLVIGRPITQSDHPEAAAREILRTLPE